MERDQSFFGVLNQILSLIPGEDEDLRFKVEHSAGEAFGNVLMQHEKAKIVVSEDDEVFQIEVFSDCISQNNEKLSLLLGHASECVKRGITLCDYFEKEHGLGHYLIAFLASESEYDSGSLVMRFYKMESLSEEKQRVLCLA